MSGGHKKLPNIDSIDSIGLNNNRMEANASVVGNQNAATTENTGTDNCRVGCCRGLPLFVLGSSVMLLCCMVGGVYTMAVIRTIERRFGLRSSQTGFLFSCGDITQTLLVVFVGYFGRRANKPRILCVTVQFSALSFLLMASPHWLFDSPAMSSYVNNSTLGSNFSTSLTDAQFCTAPDADSRGNNSESCDTVTQSGTVNIALDGGALHPAYYVFVAAQLLYGIGNSGIHSLSLAYIDENSPKSKSSFYIGIITSMYAFGPVGGFMLSAATLRLPESLMTGSSVTNEDPSFIGCWWLGYLFCAVGVVLSATPMWFFPKSLTTKSENAYQLVNDQPLMSVAPTADNENDRNSKSIWSQVKEFPKSLMHLLRNKPYVVNLGCIVCGAYLLIGVFINMVRYIEIHFFERAFISSLITALVSALAAALGGFSGGIVMTKMRLGPIGAARMMIFSAAVFSCGLLIVVFISCPQLELAGTIEPAHQSLNIRNDCNGQCGCSTDHSAFAPVCGSDNLTYLSACYAGCSDFENGVFTGCSCLIGNSDNVTKQQSNFRGANSFFKSARKGLCTPVCNQLIPYAVVMFIISMVGSMARVPSTIVNLRIVDDEERSFALAFNTFIINLVGFVPAPLLFGSLIDSTCILWQGTAAMSSSCAADNKQSAGTGSCLLYDTAKFRQRTYGVAFGIELLELILVVILYRLILKHKFPAVDDDDKDKLCIEVGELNNGSVATYDGKQRQQPEDADMTSHDRETVV